MLCKDKTKTKEKDKENDKYCFPPQYDKTESLTMLLVLNFFAKTKFVWHLTGPLPNELSCECTGNPLISLL